jgi:hypothetical protein
MLSSNMPNHVTPKIWISGYLIISKRAAGRPQDILDAEALEQAPS